MSNNLYFDFKIDKENKSVTVKKEFAANLKTVWNAWTKAEILDQWWAPKPFVCRTVEMNFQANGKWLYYMESPEGEKHYGRNDYQAIENFKSFEAIDAFCDKNGEINDSLPRTKWLNTFRTNGDTTMLTINAEYNSKEDLEQIMSMGFQEGFTMGLQNLDSCLQENEN